MKGLFKTKWTISQMTRPSSIKTIFGLLSNPMHYYAGILLKLVPGLSKRIVEIRFKSGYKVHLKDFMSFYIFNEIFVDGCYDVVEGMRERPTIMEVGGNTGYFAMRMKQLFPDATIYSFEPFTPVFKEMLKNLEMNDIKNVHPIQEAVSDESGTIKLFIHPTNIGGHSIFKEGVGDNYVEVPVKTLTQVFEEHDIDRIDLLKLDCEGAEYPIITSMTREIASKIMNLVYEPTPSQYSVKELNSHLENLGYNISEHQGMMVAKSTRFETITFKNEKKEMFLSKLLEKPFITSLNYKSDI